MLMLLGKYEHCIDLCRRNYPDGFFEFDFPYVSAIERFREIDRFLWESRHLHTRFKNHYNGPVVIDISGWGEQQFPNDYFNAFLFFIKDLESNCSCTFISNTVCSEKIIYALQEILDVKIVSLGDSWYPRTTIGFLVNDDESEVDRNV